MLGRVAAIIGGLLAIGIALRLIVAILQPVLPSQLMHDILAGWDLFYGIVSPAMVPIIAVGSLCAVGWIILGIRK
jgi:hypothetical protein